MKKITTIILIFAVMLSVFGGFSVNAEETHPLDGKKILFIGNSHTYYGKTVLEKTQSVLTQDARSNDKGFFYQLCNANGAEVSVTNWTFGGHYLIDLFDGNCAADRGCDGVDHLSYLTDRNFDYVVIQEGTYAHTKESFIERFSSVMDVFKAANPDVKFVALVVRQHYVNSKCAGIIEAIPTLKKMGVTVVDWGKPVAGIINGEIEVPDATQQYNKNSFIISKSADDGYHPNMLTGYITTLMTYCALTGESAVGQDYSFCNDSKINSAFDFDTFISKYYTYNNATTNFPEIFASEKDMKGIQTLADIYLADPSYNMTVSGSEGWVSDGSAVDADDMAGKSVYFTASAKNTTGRDVTGTIVIGVYNENGKLIKYAAGKPRNYSPDEKHSFSAAFEIGLGQTVRAFIKDSSSWIDFQ